MGLKLDFKFSEFHRNVAKLMSGTLLSQAIPLMVYPILTRTYTPDDFGVYASINATIVLLRIVSTGKYELAISLPRIQKDADSLSLLVLVLSTISALTLLILSLFVDLSQIIGISGLLTSVHLGYLLSSILFLYGWNQGLRYWSNRKKMFGNISRNLVFQFSTGASLKVGLYYYFRNFLGLIISDIAGLLVSITSYIIRLRKDLPSIISKENFIRLRSIAWEYYHFPVYQIINSGIAQVMAVAPIFFFGKYLGLSTVGFYQLALQFLNRPLAVIGVSFTDVFREESNQQLRDTGSCLPAIKKTLKSLFVVSIVPFVLLMIFAPFLFKIVFGEEWKISGQIVQVLLPLYWLRLLVSPISYVFIAKMKQEELTIWNVLVSITTVSVLGVGWNLKIDMLTILTIYSLIYSTYYILLGWRIFKL